MMEPLINRREATSIKAMIAYVAHNQNAHEDTVRAIVEAEFGVPDFHEIRRDDFERAIAYLTDIKIREHLH